MTGRAAWPFPIEGIVETVIATQQPDGAWNQAALGLHGAPGHDPTASVTARTWGDTRTRRNLQRTRGGYIQFVDDPVTFADAALDSRETPEPIEATTSAWVEVETTIIEEGTERGSPWIEWDLVPVSSEVRRTAVPRLNRGIAAVVELTVAASRLHVPAYEDRDLTGRMAYFASVIERCGTPRDREALEQIADRLGCESAALAKAPRKSPTDDPSHSPW